MDQNAPSTITLDRLLHRLEFNLTSSDGETKLKSSHYERARTGANLEHARALLLTLEKQSSSLRIQTQRQQLQANLQQKRERIKSLQTRLRELDRSDDEEDDDEDDSEGEDILGAYGPARTDTEAGIETGSTQAPTITSTQTQELRSRRPPDHSSSSTTTATATKTSSDTAPRPTATTSAREQLFAAHASTNPDLQTTETHMSHNRVEQEALTAGLLGLASALKQSSLNFASSLEAEKDVMKRAESGLDKNAEGMQAAGNKMSMLRRMSEGQGWWGRIKLYGFIFGLWVACFLFVFVGPKIRF